jgi:hypothetical protein
MPAAGGMLLESAQSPSALAPEPSGLFTKDWNAALMTRYLCRLRCSSAEWSSLLSDLRTHRMTLCNCLAANGDQLLRLWPGGSPRHLPSSADVIHEAYALIEGPAPLTDVAEACRASLSDDVAVANLGHLGTPLRLPRSLLEVWSCDLCGSRHEHQPNCPWHPNAKSAASTASAPLWDVPRPYGFSHSTQAMGFSAAPILSGFSFALLALVIANRQQFRWPGLAVTFLAAGGILLLNAMQFAFWACRYTVTPADLAMWWPDCTENATRLAELQVEQKAYRLVELQWVNRLRRVYNAGIVTFLIGIVLVLVPPPSSNTVTRWAAVTVGFLGLAWTLTLLVSVWADSRSLFGRQLPRPVVRLLRGLHSVVPGVVMEDLSAKCSRAPPNSQ